MNTNAEPSELPDLLSFVHLAYGPLDPEIAEDRYFIVEEQIRRRLWHLEEGCKPLEEDKPAFAPSPIPNPNPL